MRFVGNFDCFFGNERYRDFFSAHSENFSDRGLLVIDASLSDHPALQEVLSSLSKGGASIAQHEVITLHGEPTYDQLDALAEKCRRDNPDFLVAIGGGSLLDLAKGVSVLLTNPGVGIDYRGMGKVKNPPRPLLTIPTTAGTGSEVTWTASFIDTESHVKLGINGPNVFPYASLLEPKLLVGSPRSVAMSAALDSLVHAVEAISSPAASEFTDPIASSSIRYVLGHLPSALNEPQDPEPWGYLQMGAFLAGLAMLNSAGGPASGISYPIGVRFGVPHGFAGGILLPKVVAHNVAQGYRGYGKIMSAEIADEVSHMNGSSKDFVDSLFNLYAEIAAPSDFSKWGVTGAASVELLVRDTMETRAANLELNPVPFSKHDLRRLLDEVCSQT